MTEICINISFHYHDLYELQTWPQKPTLMYTVQVKLHDTMPFVTVPSLLLAALYFSYFLGRLISAKFGVYISFIWFCGVPTTSAAYTVLRWNRSLTFVVSTEETTKPHVPHTFQTCLVIPKFFQLSLHGDSCLLSRIAARTPHNFRQGQCAADVLHNSVKAFHKKKIKKKRRNNPFCFLASDTLSQTQSA